MSNKGMGAVERLDWLAALVAMPAAPDSAVRIAVALAKRQNRDTGRLNPSAGTLAKDAALSVRSTRRAVAWLERAGFVSVDRTDGGNHRNTSQYRLTIPAERVTAAAPVTPVSPVTEGSPQGCHQRHPRGDSRDMPGVTLLSPKQGIEQGSKQGTEQDPPIPPAAEPTTGRPDQDLLGTPQAGPPGGKSRQPSKGGDYPEAFERLWEARPRRAGNDPKPKAYQAYQARIREGRLTGEEAHAAVLRYRKFCEATGKLHTETVMQLASFFGPKNEAYLQDWALPKPAGQPGQPDRYQGLSQKDYGKTRAGILDEPDPPASDGNAGQVNHASKRTTDPNTTAHRWGRGTHAGILADAVESDQGGPGHE